MMIGTLIGAGIPLSIFILVAYWTSRRNQFIKMQKEAILSEISSSFHGKVNGGSARFELSGFHFTVWFTDPIRFGNADSGIFSVPSLFSIRCESTGVESHSKDFQRIRQGQDIGSGLNQSAISSILDRGFDEIDVGHGWVEIRKINVQLSNEFNFLKMAEICPVMPSLMK